MKCFKFLTAILFHLVFFANANAQKGIANRFSVDFSSGFSKTLNSMSPDFSCTYLRSPYVETGTRFMFNDRFGIKSSFAYHHFEYKCAAFDLKDTNLVSNSNYYKTNVDAVTNLGTIFGFRENESKIGLLLHTGLGFSIMQSSRTLKHTFWTDDFSDIMMNVNIGLQTSVRVSNRGCVSLNLGVLSHLSQTFTFDMNGSSNRQGFDGLIFYSGVGYSYYIGKYRMHYDWIKM